MPSSPTPEGPGAWRQPRVLCAPHARDALLPNGKRFADVVRGVRSLDSPGLPYLLNPVRVGGFTAWATFGGNDWRILAESGDDAFDVGARSDAYWLDALWPLAVHEECLDAADGAEALLSFAAAAGSEALERVIELARAQQRRDRYREALHRIRKACADSVDEADAVSVEVETQLAADGPGPIDEQLARIRSLVRLATSRFGGIAEMWAIDFECDLPMQGLRTRLAEHTGWCWTARDNDRLGDYASSYHAGMMFKVYDEHGSGDGPSYTLALARTPYCAKPRAQVDQAGAGLITAVGGRNPRPGHIDEWR